LNGYSVLFCGIHSFTMADNANKNSNKETLSLRIKTKIDKFEQTDRKVCLHHLGANRIYKIKPTG